MIEICPLFKGSDPLNCVPDRHRSHWIVRGGKLSHIIAGPLSGGLLSIVQDRGASGRTEREIEMAAARIRENRERDLNKVQSEAYWQVEEIRGVADKGMSPGDKVHAPR